jgi:DNA-binding XRE family transcriptional regulator
MIPTIYTQKQLAELLHVSESTISRERKDGKIKALMVRGYMKAVEV